jgi:protein TonB
MFITQNKMEAKKNPSRDIHQLYPLKLLVGLFTSIAIVITVFELQFKNRSVPTREPWEEMITMIDPNIIVEVHPELSEHHPAPKRQLALLPSVVEVATEPATQDPVLTLADPFEPVVSTPVVETVSLPPTDEPVGYADVMPTPDGGYEGFYKALRKEMRYPRRAVQEEIGGRVFVEFVIDREGNTTALKVVKGIGYGCDEEAMRVLSKIKWTAGKQAGRTVKVRMILPIHFSLNR